MKCWLVVLLFPVLLLGCSPAAAFFPEGDTEMDVAPEKELISKTQPIPESYSSPVEKGGSIVTISYRTKNYADGGNADRTNEAQIYLPEAHDREVKYDVLYLVHGHYGNASTYFSVDGGLLKNVLDHLIADGAVRPMIVVTPSYNYGQPTPDYVDADKYCRALTDELRYDLMPLIEKEYGASTDRSHRAVGGFSMGAVTTWYAFERNLDQFKFFMPFSGDSWSLGAFAGMNRPDETASFLAGIVPSSGLSFMIWAAAGTSDSAYRETLNQIEGMARLEDVFNTSNMTFHEKDGARHEYRPTIEYLYNALPELFPAD